MSGWDQEYDLEAVVDWGEEKDEILACGVENPDACEACD